MNQLTGMHVLNPLEHLIHDIFLMNVLHDTRPDNSMQVGLHKIKDQVNVLGAFGLDYVEKTDDVRMAVELL